MCLLLLLVCREDGGPRWSCCWSTVELLVVDGRDAGDSLQPLEKAEKQRWMLIASVGFDWGKEEVTMWSNNRNANQNGKGNNENGDDAKDWPAWVYLNGAWKHLMQHWKDWHSLRLFIILKVIRCQTIHYSLDRRKRRPDTTSWCFWQKKKKTQLQGKKTTAA